MIKFSYLLLFVFVLRSVQCDDVKPIKKEIDDSSSATFIRTVLCAIRTSPWQCAREQAARVLDNWELVLSEKRKSLMAEADAEQEKKIQTSRGFSESDLSREKPSSLMWTVENGILGVSDMLSESVASFTGRNEKDGGEKKKKKKKPKKKKKKKKKKPQVEYVYVEKEDEYEDDHGVQEIEINHVIHQASEDDDEDESDDYKDDKKKKKKNRFKGRKKGGYGDLVNDDDNIDTINNNDDEEEEDEDDDDNIEELDLNNASLDYIAGGSSVSQLKDDDDDDVILDEGYGGEIRRRDPETRMTVESSGRALDDADVSKSVLDGDDLPADSKKISGKGKHKKKKRGLMKLLFLGAALKAKVELLLKLLSFHLQLKFFAIATIGLIINIARFWIDMKKGHHPQKVIYYEHANHQHHYDEHGEEGGGGGYWRRSIGDRDEPEQIDVVHKQQHEEDSDAPSQYRRRFGSNNKAILSNTENDAHRMAFAAQRPLH